MSDLTDMIDEALSDAICNGDGRPTAKHLLIEIEHRGLTVVSTSGRVSENRSYDMAGLIADVRDAAENWADEAEDRGRQWDTGRNPDALDEAVNRAMGEFTEALKTLADAITAVPIGRGPDIGNAASDLAADAAQTLDVQRQAESPDPALWHVPVRDAEPAKAEQGAHISRPGPATQSATPQRRSR